MPDDKKTVKEFMTRSLVTLAHDDTAGDAAKRMRESDVGAILVTRDGKVRGIVTDRDLVVRCMADGERPNEVQLDQFCSKELLYLSPDAGLNEAIDMMREKAVRRIPVIEGDRPVGILSLGDLATKLDRQSALGGISAAPPNR